MTSLWERLEAKERRTAVLPIQVGDATTASAEVSTFRSALSVQQAALAELGAKPTKAARDRVERAQKQLEDALQRQSDTVVVVQLQSLEPDVWDAVLDGLEPDAEGDLDLGDVRAALLAESCVDEDMRDEARWAALLSSPTWSKGDTLAVNRVLLSLNLDTPPGSAGKG